MQMERKAVSTRKDDIKRRDRMKIRLCILLAAALLLTGTLPVSAGTPYALGDVNGDGVIAADDALLVLQYSVDKTSLTREQLTAADTTGNQAPNAGDALCILQKAVNHILHFPAEITKIPYTSWDVSSETSRYLRTAKETKEYVGTAMVCHSYEDWYDLVLDDVMFYYGSATEREQQRQRYLSLYHPSYFDAGNSLMLFSIQTASSDVKAFVNTLYVAYGTLYGEIDIRVPAFRLTDTLTKLYLVEVQQALPPITGIHIQANVWKGDLQNNFSLSQRAQYDFPIQ